MNYVTSDIHGRLDRLKKLIELIKLEEGDLLYILGDLVDRGDQPIETIEYVRDHSQIRVIMGNHDEMMLHSLRYEDEVVIERWGRNGCEPTIEGFFKRSKEEQEGLLDYIEGLPYYKIIDDKYLLIHGGFIPDRLEEDRKTMDLGAALMAQKDRLVWARDDFLKNKALDEFITVFGHSTRKYINRVFDLEEELPYKIWYDEKYKDKIGIDTANCTPQGRLACLRLDDLKEFYVD